MSHRVIFGGMRHMWVMVMFDLPTETLDDKRRYRRFRQKLLNDGFTLIQWSVYARPCGTMESAETHAQRVQEWIPDYGQVRVLLMTSMQFSRMRVFFGKMPGEVEKPPEQLSFW